MNELVSCFESWSEKNLITILKDSFMVLAIPPPWHKR